MAIDNPTATIPSPESDPEILNALDTRFMSIMSRFQVIKDTLGDFGTLPNELHPAAFVFNETVEDLVRFYGELPVCWAQILYEHTQKATKEVQS